MSEMFNFEQHVDQALAVSDPGNAVGSLMLVVSDMLPRLQNVMPAPEFPIEAGMWSVIADRLLSQRPDLLGPRSALEAHFETPIPLDLGSRASEMVNQIRLAIDRPPEGNDPIDALEPALEFVLDRFPQEDALTAFWMTCTGVLLYRRGRIQ